MFINPDFFARVEQADIGSEYPVSQIREDFLSRQPGFVKPALRQGKIHPRTGLKKGKSQHEISGEVFLRAPCFRIARQALVGIRRERRPKRTARLVGSRLGGILVSHARHGFGTSLQGVENQGGRQRQRIGGGNCRRCR